MTSVADRIIQLTTLLLLMLAYTTGTVQAQSEEKHDQPAQLSGQTGITQGPGGMEGMRGGQDSIRHMT
jgi:hypothetical protein